jgi:hypothetical protein
LRRREGEAEGDIVPSSAAGRWVMGSRTEYIDTSYAQIVIYALYIMITDIVD